MKRKSNIQKKIHASAIISTLLGEIKSKRDFNAINSFVKTYHESISSYNSLKMVYHVYYGSRRGSYTNSLKK